ncbi:MAG: beta strand repeat-containing protein [Thermomicrobiales bacterium]
MRGHCFVARWVAALVVGMLGVLALAPPVGAAAPISLVVTNALDNVNDANCTVGSCTLRQALNASNANDPGAGNHNTITFANGLTGPIMLTTASGGTLTLSRDVAIDGPGATLLTVDGGCTFTSGSCTSGGVTVFTVGNVTASISGLAIRHGNGTTSFGYSPSALNAGGIGNSGTLTVTSVVLTQNSASIDGGAIVNVGTLTVQDSTLSGNSAGNGGGGMDGTGATTVERSTLSGNSAGAGGGGGAIRNGGPLTVTNSTIAGNTSPFSGGIQVQGTLTVTNSTIAGNTGGRGAGGIENDFNLASLANTIVAGNTGGDLGGGAFNGSYNLIDDAATGTGFSDGASGNIIGHPAGLAAGLADNGGPTQTIALLPGSPAIDAGTNAAITNPPFTGPPFTDQRGVGFPRIVDSTVDIGAFESLGSPTYVVRSLGDGTAAAGNCVQGNDANCRLRDAIAQNEANGGGHTITFAAGLTGSIRLTVANGGTLTLARDVTIDGTGATIAVDGNSTVGVFAVNSGVTATLSALTIQHGNAGSGGGIDNNGTLTVMNSTFAANTVIGSNLTAAGGGGIFNRGTLTVVNSTFSRNSANSGFGGGGGGIYNTSTLTVTDSTFSDNAASGGSATVGGGIANFGTATLTNVLVATSTGGDLAGTFGGSNNLIDDGTGTLTGTSNLVGHPALLGTLGSYGGPTQTFPLLPGSPAINAGTSTGAPATDQRGINLPQFGVVDIGAFESQGFIFSNPTGTPQSTLTTTQFATPLGITVTANAPVEPVEGGQVTFTVTPAVSGASASLATSPATIAGGKASVTATANGTAGGPYIVTPSASGITGAASFSLTNIVSTMTVAQDATAPFSAPPQSVTLTASVTATAGTVNAGTVTFSILQNTTTIGTPVTSAALTTGTASVSYPLSASLASGAYTIQAVYNAGGGFTTSQDATHTLTIAAAPLTGIALSGPGVLNGALTLKVGQTASLAAMGTYADNSTQALPANQVQWHSADPTKVTVDASGKVTGVSSGGPVIITATQGNVTGQIAITVAPPILTGVAPAPAPASRPSGASAPTDGKPAPAPVPPGR